MKDNEFGTQFGQENSRLFLGLNQNGQAWFSDPASNQNLLICGGYGSGRTLASATIVTSWLTVNSNRGVAIVLDPFRDAAPEFSNLSTLNTAIVLSGKNGSQATRLVIESVYSELLARQHVAEGFDYSPILVLLEDFHHIPKHVLSFNEEPHQPGSAASMLLEILEEGPKRGIFILASAQGASEIEIPDRILKLFGLKLCFKCSRSDAHRLLENDLLADATHTLPRGQALSKDGSHTFPLHAISDSGVRLEANDDRKPKLITTTVDRLREKLVLDKGSSDCSTLIDLKLSMIMALVDFKNRAGLNSKELSELVKSDSSTISRLLAGEISKFSVDLLIQYLERTKDPKIERVLQRLRLLF